VRAAVAAGPSLVQSSHLKAAAGCDAGSPQYLSGNTEMAAAWPVCHLWAAKQSVVVCVHGNTGDGARECSCTAPWGHACRQTSRQADKQAGRQTGKPCAPTVNHAGHATHNLAAPQAQHTASPLKSGQTQTRCVAHPAQRQCQLLLPQPHT
jgi:hypothetical protein